MHVGASAVLPVDKEGYCYLVRQYRAPIERVLLEIPAGKLDAPDEDRLLAAKRELHEETGLSAKTWDHLADIVTTPGFSNEKISLYLARDLERGEAAPDEDEFLNVVRLPFSEAVAAAARGEIADSRPFAHCCSPTRAWAKRDDRPCAAGRPAAPGIRAPALAAAVHARRAGHL